MSTLFTTRTGAGTVAASALALMLAGIAAPAFAAPPVAPGTDAIGLAWEGSGDAVVTAESFVGTPVAVPGDHTKRTLHVRNDGPTAGTLRASITDVELRDPDADDRRRPVGGASDATGTAGAGVDQGNFYDDIEVSWRGGSASLSELARNGETPLLEIPLERGESTEISIGYAFDPAATSGNLANVAAREASFDVVISLGGDADPTLPVDPVDPGNPTDLMNPVTPTGSGTASTATVPRSEGLVDTGGTLLWAALAAAVLLPLGLLAGREGVRRSRSGRE
ncbi:hypothetical protein GCM10009847_15830 [Leucobacter tardus]|uniref:Uncharacterized protein n=1 Tax=Leucobacter tardus TaxID=501483 RepID=A0A939TVK7_9MICO|nr:hypothetical protein [Leucobacter tardus]MBO2990900.1 hypothetical protein [Leucobacter tardus]